MASSPTTAPRAFEEDSRLHHSSWVTEEALKFAIEDRDPSCPFFMHLSYLAPHPPFLAPQQYFDYYMAQRDSYEPIMSQWVGDREPRKGRPSDAGLGPFIKSEMQEAAAGYYGLTQHIDDQLSFFFNKYFGYETGRKRIPSSSCSHRTTARCSETTISSASPCPTKDRRTSHSS